MRTERRETLSHSGIDVSILMISFNTRALTLDALRSVIDQTKEISYEIIVVDNASGDGSTDAIRSEFPQVRLIALDRNIGFAPANNLASVEARGDFLLLLNPDTVVLNGAVDKLVSFAKRWPEARIWGGRTLFADGLLNPASCWRRMTVWNLFCRACGLTGMFRNSAVFNSEAYGGWDRGCERDVDIVSGCFLLVRRNFWRRLGGFAPQFFMYGEEADLCLRAAAFGARPRVTPQATIVHYGGASERARAPKMIKLLSAKALLIERHFGRGTRELGLFLLAMWPLSRWIGLEVAARLSNSRERLKVAHVWRDVWRAHHEWWQSRPRKVASSRVLQDADKTMRAGAQGAYLSEGAGKGLV